MAKTIKNKTRIVQMWVPESFKSFVREKQAAQPKKKIKDILEELAEKKNGITRAKNEKIFRF